ncbi:MAG: hypothetical protein AAF570_15860 [Bacteroidota bacterium]
MATHWLFGDSVGIDFSSGTPAATTSGMYGFEGCVSISDDTGLLQFYSNGGGIPNATGVGGVWNRNHVLMDNGDLTGTTGCLSTSHGVFAFPFGKHGEDYYMFTMGCAENGHLGTLAYSIIDMAANNGLGKVVLKDSVIATGMSTERFTGALDASGQGYWILVPKNAAVNTPDTLYAFHVTAAGILPPVKSALPSAYSTEVSVSPDRSKFLSGEYLLDFDPVNGTVSNPIFFGDPNAPYAPIHGFSPNSRLLYVWTWDPSISSAALFQFRIDTTDIPASRLALGTIGGGFIWDMQLGPDGKLYSHYAAGGVVGRVHCPNNRGTVCNVDFSGLFLPSSFWSAEHFPAFPQHIFASNDTCDTVIVAAAPPNTSDFQVFPNPTNGKVNVEWEGIQTSKTEGKISVYGSDGRLVMEREILEGNGRTEVDFSETKGQEIQPRPFS